MNELNSIGVILSTTKLHAYNPICTVPINFMHMGKSQKQTEVKLDSSINITVCFFLTTHPNYVGMTAVYEKIHYSYPSGIIF